MFQLARDGRMPNVALAGMVGLSETAVRRRLERLLRTNMVHVGAQLDPESVGFAVNVTLNLLVEPGRADDVGERLAREANVRYVALCVGQYDLIIGASFRSNTEMLDFIAGRVQSIPEIRSCRVYPLLTILKRGHEWNPLAPESAKAQPGAQAARRRPKAAKAPEPPPPTPVPASRGRPRRRPAP
ncbi:MAG: Lrp/AsnC family transcriptional regulator [Chloroflexi bacterium]|nr:Lrp/AsnC family transcriptional regulator [Chloroflexota bacterium]